MGGAAGSSVVIWRIYRQISPGTCRETDLLHCRGRGEHPTPVDTVCDEAFSLEVLQGAQNGFLETQSGSNIDLYVAAQNRLEGNILFNSTVAEMDRNRDSNWVHVSVQSPDGHQLIKAQRILFATPQTR